MNDNSTLVCLYNNRHQHEPLLINLKKMHEDLEKVSAKIDNMKFHVSTAVVEKIMAYAR
jgi:hypothetical protein